MLHVPITELQPHREQEQKQNELGYDGPDPKRAKACKVCLPQPSAQKEKMLETNIVY